MKKYILGSISLLLLFFVMYAGVYGIGKYLMPRIVGTKDTENKVRESVRDKSLLSLLYAKAPEFNLPRVEGGRTSLSQSFGVPTILIFWSTWNKASADEIHILDEYIRHQKPQTSLVSMLAINSQEDQSIVSSFMKRGGYDVPVLLDKTGEISQTYNVHDFPTFYFVSRKGLVKEIVSGEMNESLLMEKVDSLLKENSVK